MEINEIDWLNSDAKISKYFTIKEALYLPSWKILHIPSDEEKDMILHQASRMDLIHDLFNAPVIVHCWIRPISVNCPGSEYHGRDYNGAEGGAPQSMHVIGGATDYSVLGISCDVVRETLKSKLIEFDIRMEFRPGSNWVHNDCKPITEGMNRYFIP